LFVVAALLGTAIHVRSATPATSHHGTYTTIDHPQAGNTNGQGTFPSGINGQGAIVGNYYDNSNLVGFYTDTNNVAHGFIFRPGSD
jgi:hypothetical protein